MPEETVAEPPKQEAPKETPSQKFHKAMSQIDKRELGLDQSDSVSPDAPPEPQKPPTKEPEAPTKPAEPPSKPEEPPTKPTEPVTKPSSALEAAIGESKPAPKEEPLPDKLEGASDKVNENWKRARETITNLKSENEKLRAAPPQDNGYAALQKEHEDLKTRYADQENRLKGINAEYSDEYRGLLTERDKTLNKIGREVKSSGADPAALLEALQLPDGKFRRDQIKEALSLLEDDDKITVKGLMTKLSENDDAIAEFRKDLPGRWEEIVAKQEQHNREAFESNIKSLETEYGKVTESLPKDIVTIRIVPEDVEGAEDWNKDVRSSIQEGLSVLKPNGSDFNDAARVAILGKHYPKLERRFLEIYKENNEMKARLKELDASGPDFRGSKPPPPKKEEAGSKRYHKALAEIQAAQEE